MRVAMVAVPAAGVVPTVQDVRAVPLVRALGATGLARWPPEQDALLSEVLLPNRPCLLPAPASLGVFSAGQ